MTKVLLSVKHLKKYFPVKSSFFSRKRGVVHAVDGIDLEIEKGKTLGLVGESGCGKTTVGKLILRLIKPTAGEIIFDERDILSLDKKEMHHIRRQMQCIFQDPFASLNPRKTVGQSVGLPIEVHKMTKEKEEKKDMILEIFERVGLSPAEKMVDRHPHEFSGGQKQRVGIARALATRPKFIIADEPVSSLDVSIRTQILNLMRDLQSDSNLTYLLIAHDLTTIRYMSDSVVVMYLGKIMEIAYADEFFNSPQHPYTKALISVIPVPDPEYKTPRINLKGTIPSSMNLPSGCRFRTRCPHSKSICQKEEPQLEDLGGGHMVACHKL